LKWATKACVALLTHISDLSHFLESSDRRYHQYWLLLAESHLTRWLFGSMVRQIASLPLPAG
jgi:hypothetical protein